MNRRVFLIATSGVIVTGAASAVFAQGPGMQGKRPPGWGAQADKEFRLGRGLAPRLMTEEEWKEHQAKMRSMTPEERQKYRQDVHQKMLQRAQEKGIEVPAPQPPQTGRKSPS